MNSPNSFSYQSSQSENQPMANIENAKLMSLAALNQKYHQKIYREGTFNILIRYLFLQEEILSSGGEGLVIVVHDRVTHQDLVVKKRKFPLESCYLAKRTHREFLLSQIVDHKNVIRLLNAFTPQKSPGNFSEVYFVTEYIRYPLVYLIREGIFNKPGGGEIMSFLTYQLLCGIRHLHKAGIIHRDLSVSNIMVESKDESIALKIIDFGAARVDPDKQQKNVTAYVTMRYYRAPEMILGIKEVSASESKDIEVMKINEDTIIKHYSEINYDRKVDVWSAGCILAEMITGQILFKGEHYLDQWNRIIQVVGSPKQDYIERLPEGIKEYVQKYPHYEPKPWDEMFTEDLFPIRQSLEPLPICTAQTARDLLSKMLVIDPLNRLSIDQALEHVYVGWKQEPGELKETYPVQNYNGYIEELEYTENEWKTIIFFELKQYELMNSKINDTPIHDCQKCIQHRCRCPTCNQMNVERLLPQNNSI